jgi:predicted O-linked N-acetylglucosamine transferase (SPINDLY family)
MIGERGVLDPLQAWYVANADSTFRSRDPWILADRISDDCIDILVDLDSVTTDVACMVVALKPAPMICSWLGWDASGLPEVDYYLADKDVVPPAQAKLYRERVVYLPDVFVATDGFSIGVPSVTRESLAIPEDAIVFYSAQTGYKRNPTNIRVQLQAVSAVPGSTFVVKGTDDLEFKSMVMEAARASGVDNDRLRFMPADPSPWVHRANMQIADIVLDTFPYNGTTTSLEALWMGIPLVTKLGNHYAGRTSYTFLRSCDVAETVSHTDAEYIEIGRRLGTELQFREGVRRKLAEARASAAVFNGRLFARQMEAVYEQLLRRSAST